ncbi:MAG: DUF928 domain-containing protein [Leptolyngbyaceae cyanobacterium CRU_2_3]|nr:DUF928 domain-containing protein [Leptolyngbyaceae cyanobacterium CRU_2_3]
MSDARSTATGVVGITLPDTITLEAEKSYQWVFMVNCEMDNPIFTRGNIQKVNLDTALTQQIARSEPLQQARLYAENGIWFDALTTLAVLRMDQPEDQTIAAAWRSLLRSVDLADIIGKPFMRP